MGTIKRSTVYLDSEIHKALKLRSAENECSVSELINEALRSQLSEDAEDLIAIDERKNERSTSFEDFVKKLKKNGKL